MVTYILCFVALIVGYIVYGALMDKIFGTTDKLPTPAITMADGLDYIPLKTSKSFLIQFLNIAGTGPIFGPIAGALWGPAAFFWIVFGCIFGGAVHDFLIGMMSVRHKGASVSELVGDSLGEIPRWIMRVFSIVLLILVGVVFVKSPADLLAVLTPEWMDSTFWIVVILLYYVLATLLPIDALIAKVYPVFGLALLIMGVGIAVTMVTSGKITQIPEFSFANLHPQGQSIFPYVFISIACGAVSGFHATQCPLISRCIKKESEGRKVFYGAMITEGALALVWAGIAMVYFDGGIAGLQTAGTAAVVVEKISSGLMGPIGMILAIIGVAACPITSGDTAFRSARLNIADIFSFDQRPIVNRFIIVIPMFAVAIVLLFIDFNIIWRYFAWANQTLAAIVLWAGAGYLKKRGKMYWIAVIPAMFMTVVTTSYIVIAPEGFSMSKVANGETIGVVVALVVCAIVTALFFMFVKSNVVVSEEIEATKMATSEA